MNRLAIDVRGFVFLFALVGLWWIATGPFGLFPASVLPSPVTVWHSFLQLGFSKTGHGGLLLGYGISLWGHIAHSVGRLLVAFLIAIAIAVPVGILMASIRVFDDLLDPIAQSLRPIPPIAWTPLAILWFGLGLKPILFIIVLGALWPILLNTIAGVREVPPVLIRAAQSLGTTRPQMFWRVMLPAAMPFIYTGMRSGLTVGWWMIVPAEMIASNNGLGFLIMRSRENGHMQDAMTGIIAIGLVGYCLLLMMSWLGRLRLFRGS